MSHRKARDLLTRFQDAALEDLENCSDADLQREAAEEGVDIDALADALRSRISKRLMTVTSGAGRDREGKPKARTSESAPDTRAQVGTKMLAVSNDDTHLSCPSPNNAEQNRPADDVRSIAETALLKLGSTCLSNHNRHLSHLPDARYSEIRSVLIERLLCTYFDNSEELADLFPGSYVQLFRNLLRVAMQDSQISQFADISMGALASTLCTISLGKASGLDFGQQLSAGQRDRFLRQIRLTKTWRAFHRLTTCQPEMVTDSVDAPRAVTGLAAMQAALEDYRPDAIIAVAGGGEIVADFLGRQLKIENKCYFVASPRNGEYTLDRDLFEGGSLKRVVIIDDISRTGRTLSCIRYKTLGTIRSVDFRALALVSAATATTAIKDFLLLLPVVSHSSNVSVPWDNKGSFKATRTNYVFGADRREPLEVSKSFYERTYSDVKGVSCRSL
jgi:adenine/guanine phosphoribosyltransferase-like PRPP-binding protein